MVCLDLGKLLNNITFLWPRQRKTLWTKTAVFGVFKMVWWNIERGGIRLQWVHSVTQYTAFTKALFLLLECHAVSRHTVKYVSFIPIRKVRHWNYADFHGPDKMFSSILCVGVGVGVV